MICLGLDIATVTGAAFDSADAGVPRLVTFRAPRPEGDNASGFDFSRTFGEFHRWLAELIAVVKPGAVAIEAPLTLMGRGGARVQTSQSTVRVLFGLAAIAEMTAYEGGSSVYEVNVATVKKFFAGTGRADKAAMIGRCRQLNWPCKNDHEADAAACWAYIKSLTEPQWAPRALPLFAHRGAA